MAPSDEFLLLAATLLEALPPSLPISDTLLLQLHGVFGPMLMSALQLVDKREVVKVTLPSDRHIYQVSSSTGKNYTLHLDPPLPIQPSFPPPPSTVLLDPDPNSTLSPPTTPNPDNPFNPDPYETPIRARPKSGNDDDDESKRKEEKFRRERVMKLASQLRRMYCPCAGFAYNSLAGERTVLCKHLLAVIVASKTGREVKAEVGLQGVAGLLGLER
ncbi:hypothetical protein CI109_105616 [Kwoniella shandongensis]|uniref:Uncharacterized protein n=1 Tax=Kwoniella shandongensis TaxID=1734106 RepID=A0A5M6C8A2_9TREE|nr:uncharacterized protein CI109_002332 [Kwoniella shandongensis]KAA5529439.1 hypothetical protein CI109_002332 [Kwoniella shandongensis]